MSVMAQQKNPNPPLFFGFRSLSGPEFVLPLFFRFPGAKRCIFSLPPSRLSVPCCPGSPNIRETPFFWASPICSAWRARVDMECFTFLSLFSHPFMSPWIYPLFLAICLMLGFFPPSGFEPKGVLVPPSFFSLNIPFW